MFQDTLLIIKSDFMHRRKLILTRLIDRGFMIKAQRKIQFKPEDAAEFYQERIHEEDFMLRVILLSKGVSEAFILAKENAVTDLINTMICYFTTSADMAHMVHVTLQEENVQFEINFIFPNYICEPIPVIRKHKLQSDPLLGPLIEKMSQIVQSLQFEPQKSWKVQLAEWLLLENKDLPVQSNRCSTKAPMFTDEKALQVKLSQEACASGVAGAGVKLGANTKFADVKPSSTCPSTNSSLDITSSSCISCNCFNSTDPFEEKEKTPAGVVFYRKVAALPKDKKKKHKSHKEAEAEEEECMCEGEVCEACKKHLKEQKAAMAADAHAICAQLKKYDQKDNESAKVKPTKKKKCVKKGNGELKPGKGGKAEEGLATKANECDQKGYEEVTKADEEKKAAKAKAAEAKKFAKKGKDRVSFMASKDTEEKPANVRKPIGVSFVN